MGCGEVSAEDVAWFHGIPNIAWDVIRLASKDCHGCLWRAGLPKFTWDGMAKLYIRKSNCCDSIPVFITKGVSQ